MTQLLQKIFERVFAPGHPAGAAEQDALLHQAVDHLVQRIDPGLCALGDYQARLRPAVELALEHIDGIVEAVPEGFVCSRRNYLQDRRVNAFFVSPDHLSEVFSASRELRDLFQADAALEQAWGLLCMRRRQQRRLGMGLLGDTLVRDLAQQVVSFGKHQLLSPGEDLAAARKALKCCIFNNLLDYIKTGLVTGSDDRAANFGGGGGDNGGASPSAIAFRAPVRAMPLRQRLQRVVEGLRQPQRFVRLRQLELRLDRMGVMQEAADVDRLLEPLRLSEIEIAGRGARVAALVAVRREDLLPAQDMARNAEIFLAM